MRVSSACLGPLATNCYLIEMDTYTLLVDPADASPELDALIGNRSIDAVVLTHELMCSICPAIHRARLP